MQFKIAPSLMCADLVRLDRDIEELERARVDYLHLDVMDGHFVPNLGLSIDLASQIQACTKLPLDVHLMVANPESYIERITKLSVRRVSFHWEATANAIRLARAFRREGTQVGVAINPSTPPEALRYLFKELDFVLVMTVEPGFAGQKFIPQMLCKIEALRCLLSVENKDCEIEVDGNLDARWASECLRGGASVLVAGTASVFRGDGEIYRACVEFRRELDRLHCDGPEVAQHKKCGGGR